MIPEGVFYLYVIERSGKAVYVGQTQNPRKRWHDHRSAAGRENPRSAIAYAMRKYGAAAFNFCVLPVVFESRTSIDAAEIHMISALGTHADSGGYNRTYGGLANYPSSEGRRRLSEARSGKPLSEAHKVKLAAAKVGRVLSLETRRRMTEAQVKRWASMPIEKREEISERHRQSWFARRAS